MRDIRDYPNGGWVRTEDHNSACELLKIQIKNLEQSFQSLMNTSLRIRQAAFEDGLLLGIMVTTFGWVIYLNFLGK